MQSKLQCSRLLASLLYCCLQEQAPGLPLLLVPLHPLLLCCLQKQASDLLLLLVPLHPLLLCCLSWSLRGYSVVCHMLNVLHLLQPLLLLLVPLNPLLLCCLSCSQRGC
jgi:hypothetical protein